MSNLKSIKRRKYTRKTKYLTCTIVALTVMLLIVTSTSFFYIVNEAKSLKNENIYRNYLNKLFEVSDYLTYEVSYYVVTGNEQNLDNYMYEINVANNREKAIENVRNIGFFSEEVEILEDTLKISDELSMVELNAIELMQNGNQEEAIDLIYSDMYIDYKTKIRANYDKIIDISKTRISTIIQKIIEFCILVIFTILLIVVVVSICAIMLLINFFKLKEESDIDGLTRLQNRNNYKEKIKKIIDEEPNKYGALIYCDIDNLKFVNENYGHNNGDVYIKTMGDKLRIFEKYKSVLSRPSGDEFIIYIHGFDNENEVIKVVENKINKIREGSFYTTANVKEKMRFSTGIAIYDSDSKDIDKLIEYADFALSNAKKKSKGEITFYDKKSFEKSAFSFINKGYLDDFLEKEILEFAFQPIVDANTFDVYGYEALMRPQLDVINTPLLLLQLAKAESKLDKVEKLVFKNVLHKIIENKDKLNDYKVFINSISNQAITSDELETYVGEDKDILENIVIEITEQEYADDNLLEKKTEMFRKYNTLIALDDYGAGYSNEFTLLSGIYDIIKIDMKIVHGIDTDSERQEIVKSILKVADINNYKVLAEGVETIEQVKILRKLGIHYLQGYFFGKPQFDIMGINEETFKKLKDVI